MIDYIDRQLITLLQKGLAIVSRPYALLGKQLDITEDEVISRISTLKQIGLIKRLGVIVNHRRLNYCANAMVVFDVPDHLVEQISGHVCQFDFVNLCYLRPRHGEEWSYNLYCMIHGKNREKVLKQLAHLIHSCGLTSVNYEVLFSKKCFKQRSAFYNANLEQEKVFSDG
ncbi:MAG: AsnC family transcriptional regulator [Methylococcaceae bacterium]|nr:AsnC family transcriptional regulator [Methylococcaceae bacterium]